MTALIRLLIPVISILFLLGCSPEAAPAASEPTSAETVPAETVAAPEETQKEDAVMETQPIMLIDPKDSDFVCVKDYIPDIQEELKYATSDNFTGTVIYDFQHTYLRYGTVKKLMAVQEELREMGLGLKLWDGFRPISAQFKLWDICPDDTYVANPNVGFSNHSRGNAVDLTIVDANGEELDMPTGFDDFSGRADRNYAEIPESQKANSLLLEGLMEKHGFKGYYGEWWHYNDTVRYDPEHVFDPGLISLWQVSSGDDLPLAEPGPNTQPIALLPCGTVVTVMGYDGDRALIEYNGIRGYVECIRLIPFG